MIVFLRYFCFIILFSKILVLGFLRNQLVSLSYYFLLLFHRLTLISWHSLLLGFCGNFSFSQLCDCSHFSHLPTVRVPKNVISPSLFVFLVILAFDNDLRALKIWKFTCDHRWLALLNSILFLIVIIYLT